MDYIDELKAVILRLHGCGADHVASVPVLERFQGQTVWEGMVEVFEIKGHAKASRCYAWAHRHGKDDKKTRYVAVLGVPPVDSPLKAVQVSIAAESKR